MKAWNSRPITSPTSRVVLTGWSEGIDQKILLICPHPNAKHADFPYVLRQSPAHEFMEGNQLCPGDNRQNESSTRHRSQPTKAALDCQLTYYPTLKKDCWGDVARACSVICFHTSKSTLPVRTRNISKRTANCGREGASEWKNLDWNIN